MKGLKRTLRSLFEVLFPKRSDATLVSETSPTELIALMNLREVSGASYLLPFGDPRVRACIHEVKWHENYEAVSLLAAVLKVYLEKNQADVIIPIPLSGERLAERKYNQVTLMARPALKGLDVKLVGDILLRSKDTKPQTTLSRKERLTNVTDAFSITDQMYATRKLAGKNIIILDDVTTTGATLRAARSRIAPLGASSITCLALAH